MYRTMRYSNRRAPLDGVSLNVGIGIIDRTDKSVPRQIKGVIES